MSVATQKPVQFNYTEGSIYRALFILALPATATTFIRSLHSIYDAWLIGHGTASHLAALTGASFFLWMTYAFVQTISVGANALVARFVGADKPEELSVTALSALLGGGVFAVVLGVILFALSSQVVSALGLAQETAEYAERYLRVLFLGLPAIYGYSIIEGIFRGTGDAKTPLFLLLALLVTHFILAPLLAFGVLFIKPMLLAGLATSMVIAHTIGCIAGSIILIRRRVINRDLGLKIHLGWLWQMVRIGLPLAFAHAFFSGIYVGLARIVVLFGDPALASLGVGHRVESISYMTAVGFSQATAALVGQNLGAGKPERAESATWKSAAVISIFTGFVALVMLLFSVPLADFFTDDPKVIEYCSAYLEIVAISQIAMGISIVLEGAFSGAGDTFIPMVIMIFTALIRLPLSYLLAMKMDIGVTGVFWVISGTTILACFFDIGWFLHGRWKITLAKRLANKEVVAE
ncbi:MAG: MATE family efflux transporter [Myxococcota bacterium]